MFTNGRCPHDVPTSNCRFHLLAPKRALASTAADRACTRRPPRDCIPNPVARFGSLPRFTREGRLQGLAPLISPLRVAAIAGNISPVTPMGFVPLQGLPTRAAPGSPPRLPRSRRCRLSLDCHLNSSLHRLELPFQLARGLTFCSARSGPESRIALSAPGSRPSRLRNQGCESEIDPRFLPALAPLRKVNRAWRSVRAAS